MNAGQAFKLFSGKPNTHTSSSRVCECVCASRKGGGERGELGVEVAEFHMRSAKSKTAREVYEFAKVVASAKREQHGKGLTDRDLQSEGEGEAVSYQLWITLRLYDAMITGNYLKNWV